MSKFWKMTVEHNGDVYPWLPGETEELILQGPDTCEEEIVKKQMLSVHKEWVDLKLEKIERPEWATAFIED